MASQVTLKALGLNYSPNNLALPEGSLVVADDVIVRRDNVLESRRGFREYSETFGAGADRSNQLIVYKDRILNHYNSILQYDTGVLDNDGKAIFENFNGTYTEVQNGLRIKSIEANKNLYFTTDKGIKKISARTAADFTTDSGFIDDAGGIKATDFTATLNITQGQTAGFLPVDSVVAYRILWGYRDLNENLILGAPSDSISVYNYLSNIISLDLNTFLIALDNCVQNTSTYYSVLHNSTTYGTTETFGSSETFSDKFRVNITDDATVYAANVNSTAEYIDKFSTLGDNTATYTFTVTALGTQTNVGAIYNDALSGNTFTVTTQANIGATSLVCTGTGDPATGISGTTNLTYVSGTGQSPTIAYSAYSKVLPFNKPLQINTQKTYTFTVSALGSAVTAGTIYRETTSGAIFVANTAASAATTFTAVGSNNPSAVTGLNTSINLTRISGSGGPATITYTAFTVAQAGFSSTSGIGSIEFTADPSNVFSEGDLIEITSAVDGNNDDYSFTLNKRYTFTLSTAASIPTFSTFTSNGQTFTVIPFSSPLSHTLTYSTASPVPAASDVYGYTEPSTGYTYRYTFNSGATSTSGTAQGLAFPAILAGGTITLTKISGTGANTLTCSSIRLTTTNTTLICTGTGAPTSAGAATSGTLLFATKAFNISSVSIANPTTITTASAHGLYTGETVTISGTNTTASTVGTFIATVTGASTFTIPVNVTVVTTGTGTGVNATAFAFTGYTQSDSVVSTGSVYTNNSQRFTTTSYTNLTTLASAGTGSPNAITATTILSLFSGNGDTVLQYSAFTRGTASYTSFNNTSTGTTINKYWTITSVDSTNKKILFNIASTSNIAGGSAGASVKLLSYNYRNITQTGDALYTTPLSDLVVSTPATSEQLRIIQNTISRLATRLKNEKSGYISSALKTAYVSNFSTTSYANVSLDITVPQSISSTDYFLQVYRTRNFTATGANILGVDVTPDEEMRLVYEVFPITTLTPLPTSYSFIDEYPEALRDNNVNLYTNPVTGEGISQANDVPPVAKDINRFKNVVFYANTKTRHRLNPFQLVGTSNINTGDSVTISDGTTTSIYEFVEGAQEVTRIAFGGAITPANLQNKYFNINSAEDETQYYVWYRVDNAGTDPAVASKTAIRVDILTGDTPTIIRDKTLNTINAFSLDFIAERHNTYTFTVSGGPTVTAGDIYSNNDIAYTVVSLVGTTLTCTGSAAPQTSGTLLKVSGNVSSSTSITYSTFSLTSSLALNVTNTNFGITTNATTSPAISAFVTITTPVEGNGENALSTPPKVLLSKVSTSVTASQAIDETARSLVRIINKQSSSTITAYYISSSTSLPGQINLESELINDIPFYVQSSTIDVGRSFNPTIEPYYPDSNTIERLPGGTQVKFTTSTAHGLNDGDNIFISLATVTGSQYLNGIYSVTNTTSTVPYTFTINKSTSAFTTSTYNFAWSKLSEVSVSNNETKPNRVYYSKLSQPEAVPLLNYFDIGAADKAILRIFPLRDSLFVFKQDGLYRISGEVAPFVIGLFDSSCVLIAPDSVSVANNVIYGWSTKGISNITESGVTEISRPIDTVILKLASTSYTNFSTATWGLGYDSDNSYTVYTCQDTEDELATIAFRFSNLTNTWTNFKRSQTCGVIRALDDRIYTGSGTNNAIDQERKNFDRTDFSDEDFNLTINNGFLNSDQVQVSSAQNISIGDVLTQVQSLTVYRFNSLLAKLDLDATVGEYGYTASPIGSTTITITTTQYGTISPAVPHYLSTGDWINVDSSNSSPSIDGEYQITVTGANTFTIEIPYPLITLPSGTGNKITRNYSKTFEAATGDNLRNKLVLLAAYLDTDPNLTPPVSPAGLTYSNIVGNKMGPIASVGVGNPGVINTASAHQLLDDRVITISGTIGPVLPNILETYQINVTGSFPSNFGSTSFQIPENITTPSSGATSLNYDTGSNELNIKDIAACYNGVVGLLNQPGSGTSFKNYPSITSNTTFEAIVTAVNKALNLITLNLPIQLVVGDVTIYKSIPCNVIYAPLTFGDPLQLKQVYESTLMFSNKAFYKVTAGFSSDLKPEFTYVEFEGQGNGNFGDYSNPGFGYGFFGGSSNAAPCRTLVPRQNQRCRFINMRFSHSTAREIWSLYGITLTFNPTQSTRAYR